MWICYCSIHSFQQGGGKGVEGMEVFVWYILQLFPFFTIFFVYYTPSFSGFLCYENHQKHTLKTRNQSCQISGLDSKNGFHISNPFHLDLCDNYSTNPPYSDPKLFQIKKLFTQIGSSLTCDQTTTISLTSIFTNI